uniref:Uncharacterized protein n=1 Tax=uncultured marine group II/III euryarchaeote KM3_87_G11 TaxID=1456534 RepID=A0A075HWB0_9EURY|nr:hypothetical protein [uncultured marine group II/III euryarchaeote KM3_87_G11]
MTIDSKPDGDDLTQFVCSGVNFDIEEKPTPRRRRSKLDGAKPRVGFGSLRSRADADKPSRGPRRRRVRKKDDANMSSLYSYEGEDSGPQADSRPIHGQELLCSNCDEPHDIAHLLDSLEPHIEQIVKHRVEAREVELRQELVAEFQRRKMASEQK